MNTLMRLAMLAVAGLSLSSAAIPAHAAIPAPPAAARVKKSKVEKPPKRHRNRKTKAGKSRGKHS